MTVNAVPTPTLFPIQFGQRDAKVIETATLAAGTVSNKNLDATCTYDAAPVIAAGTLTEAQLAPEVQASVTVSVTAANIAALYATPKQLIAAPAAGKAIIVESIEVLHTYAVAVFADGGVCKVQYDNTVHGAGTAISPALESVVTAGATSNGFYGIANTSVVDAAAITAKGVFLSNATGAFTGGNVGNVLKIRVTYRVVTVVA